MEENFRSTQQILDVANNSISNTKDREPKHLIAFGNKSGSKPQLIQSDNNFHPQIITEGIKELSNTFEYKDIAVLCRTKAQVKTISEYLTRNQIPTRTYLINYFEIPEIKDLLAWCNVIAETENQDAGLYRLISRLIDENTANNVFSQFSKRDYTSRFELIRNYSDSDLSNLIDKIIQLRNLNKKKNGSEMVWEICLQSNIFKPLINNYEWQDQLAILNIGQFIDRSVNFTTRHQNDNSLRSFTKYMTVLQKANGIQAKYPNEKYVSQTVLSKYNSWCKRQ